MTGYVNEIFSPAREKNIRDSSKAISGKISQNGNMLECRDYLMQMKFVKRCLKKTNYLTKTIPGLFNNRLLI